MSTAVPSGDPTEALSRYYVTQAQHKGRVLFFFFRIVPKREKEALGRRFFLRSSFFLDQILNG
jgi:hypothetical protein